MKNYIPCFIRTAGLGATLAGSAVLPLAGQQNQERVEELRLQVEEIQAESQRRQATHQRQLDELQAQLDSIEAEREARSTAEAPDRDAARSARPREGVLPRARSDDFLNVSAIGTFAAGTSTAEEVEELQNGDHDPGRRGFDVQGLELAFDGIVDPFFRAQANLVFGLGEDHGASVELEEAYLETLALPAGLQVRAGQYFTEFGRHNTQHLHYWKFVDAPLVNTRMFGADGLRNPGARVSWLAPTPVYSELFFGVQNSTGETAYSFRNPEGFRESEFFFRGQEIDHDGAEEVRNMKDLLYTTRFAVSHDLTPTQTLLGGVSAAFGPNSPTEDSASGRTEIYGADIYWLWTPDRAGAYPFVNWQTELMYRRFEMRDPSNVFDDWGLYSQINYGFARGWVAGLRYDIVRGEMHDIVDDNGDSLDLAPDRWRLSPNLTYHPSEFSKIRLQYNYDERKGFGDDHTVWLQWEFALGPHAAHPF